MAIKTCTSCNAPVVMPHAYGSGRTTVCPACDETSPEGERDWGAKDEEAAAEVDLVLSDDKDYEA